MVSEMFKTVWEQHVKNKNEHDWEPHQELWCQHGHAKSMIQCLKNQKRRDLIKIAENCREVAIQYQNEGEGWIAQVYWIGRDVILSYLGKKKGAIVW